MDYKDLDQVNDLIKRAESAQYDQVLKAKECQVFVTKPDGQWEQSIIHKFRGRPRYTDDRVNPIINQIVGEVNNSNFSGRVRPAGGEATRDTADTFDGLIRTIRNKSNFARTKQRAARKVAISGVAGWEIVKDYATKNSFDQDLLIKPIEDYFDRVVLDPDDNTEDGRDAKWCRILHYVGVKDFESQFPEAQPISVGQNNWSETYYQKRETIKIGQLYYLKPVTKTLVRMNNQQVFERNEDFEKIEDDLYQQGILVEAEREVDTFVCCQRWFSGKEWLTEEEELDFDCIPVVPCYGNFEVIEGKVVFEGIVQKLMDQQRVHNYAFSRNVEEVALSPRNKWFMTPEQAAGHQKSLQSMNTNHDPVQLYNHVSDQTPPYWSNSTSLNPAVSELVERTDIAINKAAGIFAANIGDNPMQQSGYAIEQQIDRGNNGTSWIFASIETAIKRTCEILISAIPKVYDATREVTLTQEDGALENIILNQPVVDAETGQTVYINDLSKGEYDVTIEIGKAYKNRQQEAVEAFERIAAVDPSILQIAGDIHLKNIDAPNFDKVAERARLIQLQNGTIPETQMTEEEKAMVQQQQEAAAQNPPVDLQKVALEIEQMKAQTQMMDQQNRAQEHQLKMEELGLRLRELQMKAQGQQQKLESDLRVDAAKIQQEDKRIAQKAEELAMKVANEQAEVRFQYDKMLREMALKLADIEARTGTQQDSNVKENIRVFDIETGQFV